MIAPWHNLQLVVELQGNYKALIWFQEVAKTVSFKSERGLQGVVSS
jgi:hypothetical protein